MHPHQVGGAHPLHSQAPDLTDTFAGEANLDRRIATALGEQLASCLRDLIHAFDDMCPASGQFARR